MTNHSNHSLVRLAPLAAAAALLATACGASTTTSSTDLPGADVAADEVTLEGETTADELQTPPETSPVATDPEPEPEPEVDPEVDMGLTAPPGPCGEFGPLPENAMATHVYDTDGDGQDDDAVTPFGDPEGDGWILRVVENGQTSEALMAGIPGFAVIANTYDVDGRDYIEFQDQEVGTLFTLATVDGCVEVLHVEPGPDEDGDIDDFAQPTPTDPPPPPPAGPGDFAAPAPAPCGVFSPIPANASTASNLTVDVAADGTADDQIITYLDGDWTIRAIVDGITSEVTVHDVGPGAVRAVGIAPVGELTAGNEIIATVSAGAYTVQIGVFGIDDDGCLFHFLDAGGNPLAMSSGASISFGDRFSCGDGYIAATSWSRQADDTYDIGSAAYIESTPGQFTYMPASDDFGEGLTIDDLPDSLFDCNGLAL